MIVASEDEVDFGDVFSQPHVVGRPHVSQGDNAVTTLRLQLSRQHRAGLHVVRERHLLRVNRGQRVQPLLLNKSDL